MVRFHLDPAARERARSAMIEVAPLMREVPGCLRFDVLEPDGDAEYLWFSELWRDKAAFEEHWAARPPVVAALSQTIAGAFASPPLMQGYHVLI